MHKCVAKVRLVKFEFKIANLIARKVDRTSSGLARQTPVMPTCGTDSLSAFKCDEAGRLRALERLDILDSAPEEPFESLVQLVRQVLSIPICAVTLVDQDRQWFKAHRGLGVSETGRDVSFCTHAIRASEPFIVSDAAKDPRFANNPLVIGGPKIRSYVGIPLTTPDGYNIGTLCAIDVEPREFSQHEIAILTNFAKVVVGEIELRLIASTDFLTGIMSRRAWLDCAEREVCRANRYGSQLSFLVLDIDNFKGVNDRFGHPVGDQIITGIAQGIAGQLRESDCFGRFGGEEFVAALPETDFAAAMNLAERIREAIARMQFPCLEGEFTTVSIGVSSLGHDEAGPDPALIRADQALFHAKQMGRNRIHGVDASDQAWQGRAAA